MAKKTPGRWDHLLREISSPTTSRGAEPIPERREPTITSTSPSNLWQAESVGEPHVGSSADETPSSLVNSEPRQTVLSVSDINRAIKAQLEGEFQQVWVRGEISNFKAHGSGHYYFSLKDDKSQISCVMFKGYNQKLPFQPEGGLEVLLRGRVTVFEPRGNYQIFCEFMEPVGAGALQKAFEQLKSKLQKEGLFDASQKKSLPVHPHKLAVVTSASGAAIQDILNVLRRRSPRLAVTVIPARVQGEGAAKEIARGIELANQVGDFDVMIVGRGGGSLEDLWAFNEEVVARAIHASRIPIISAVGHEIDFTIADFVADYRAPTPSAAAEVVAQSEQEIIEKLLFYERTLRLLADQLLTRSKQKVGALQKRLVDPRRSLLDQMQRLDEISDRLQHAVGRLLERKRLLVKMQARSLPHPQQKLLQMKTQLAGLQGRMTRAGREIPLAKRRLLTSAQSLLDSLSPLRVVERGYGLVRQKGRVIADVQELDRTETVHIQLRDGSFIAQPLPQEEMS